MKKILILLVAIIAIIGCKDDDEIEYMFPKEYFPAFPESYWVYSDGNTIAVSPGYHRHSYYEDLETTVKSKEFYVPKIGEQYVYEYEITQNNNRIPLKQLLSESNGEEWEVGYYLDGVIKRKVIAKDTLVTLTTPLLETQRDTFGRCIVVIEYYEDSDTIHPWLSKEIYAPKVGLIREEVKRDGDSLILKELVKFYISQDI